MGRGEDDRREEEPRDEDARWAEERARTLSAERREPVRLIWQAWDHDLTDREKQTVREYVARRGFDPSLEIPVPQNVWGIEYEGRTYGPGDRELTGTVHFLDHAFERGEWPDDTPEYMYYRDAEEIVLDPDSRMFVNRFRDERTGELRPQLGFIGKSEDPRKGRYMRGPEGREDVLVEFRLDRAHIATALQRSDAAAHVERQAEEDKRRDLRWLT